MFPGTTDEWQGYTRYTFELDGATCHIVPPKQEKPGRPWLWRARFWGAFPFADLAALEQGYHLVHIDIGDLFGSAKATRRWDLFYKKLTEKFGFSPKCCLEGMSRGGLIVFNWAKQNVDKVACIYVDNPVCDFKSWPGGKEKGPGAPEAWAKCLEAYGFTEAEAIAYKGNPVDTVEPLVKAKTPILFVQATADSVVPMEENATRFIAAVEKLGGKVEAIYKEGFDHHPHCLEDPTPILDFMNRSIS